MAPTVQIKYCSCEICTVHNCETGDFIPVCICGPQTFEIKLIEKDGIITFENLFNNV